MIETDFVNIIQKIATERGKDIFLEHKKLKSLLLDYTKNEYKKEISLLSAILEADIVKIINTAEDLVNCKQGLVKRLEDENNLSPSKSGEMLDLLFLVLRGKKVKIKVTKDDTDKHQEKINSEDKEVTKPAPQSISLDYEAEAKAERLYQTAINCFFKDIGNNFTVAIGNLIKAIKLSPNNARLHYYFSYCLYKVNDISRFKDEIQILKNLNYDENVRNKVDKDIFSSRKGMIAERLYNAFIRGGSMRMSAAKSSIYKTSRINYQQQEEIYKKYMDYKNWQENFDKHFAQIQ